MRWEDITLVGALQETHEDLKPASNASGRLFKAVRSRSQDRMSGSHPGVRSWTGIAIGGLSVGEPKDKMYQTIEVLEARLPATLPRYLNGRRVSADLVAAVERGVDLFDCVAPTRGGRNGSRSRRKATTQT